MGEEVSSVVDEEHTEAAEVWGLRGSQLNQAELAVAEVQGLDRSVEAVEAVLVGCTESGEELGVLHTHQLVGN